VEIRRYPSYEKPGPTKQAYPKARSSVLPIFSDAKALAAHERIDGGIHAKEGQPFSA
jgi:hypothetical protein